MTVRPTGATGAVTRSDFFAAAAAWFFCVVLVIYISPVGKDLIAEQMVARAVVDGIGPYAPLSELQERYGGPVDWEFTSPRTPAAIGLVVPMASIPTATLIQVMTVVHVTAMLAVAILSARMAGRSLKVTALMFPLLVGSGPGGSMIAHANLSPLIGLAVVWTWWSLRKGDSWVAGLPLGIAASVRLFPGVLALVLLVGGRRRAGLVALAATVALNLAGLLIPGVTFAGSVRALAGTDEFFAHSGSFSVAGVAVRYGLPFSIGRSASLLLPAILVLWVVIERPRWERGMLLTAPLMLLVNPTSWPHYMATAGPSVARLHRTLLALVLVLWQIPVLGAPIGLSLMISLVVVVLGLSLGYDVSRERRDRGLERSGFYATTGDRVP